MWCKRIWCSVIQRGVWFYVFSFSCKQQTMKNEKSVIFTSHLFLSSCSSVNILFLLFLFDLWKLHDPFTNRPFYKSFVVHKKSLWQKYCRGLVGAESEEEGEADVSTLKPCHHFRRAPKLVVLPVYFIAARHIVQITCILSCCLIRKIRCWKVSPNIWFIGIQWNM